MSNLRISIQTRSLRQPLKQALHTAARLQADGVEIDVRQELPVGEISQTGLRQLRKLLGDLGLRVAAVAFPTRRGYGESEDLERRILATQQAMKLAYELGAWVVCNRVGTIPEQDDDPRFDRLVQSLTLLGAAGEKYGARLAILTGSESGPQVARLLGALPAAEAVGATLDPGTLISEGHSPESTIADLGSAVIHVHATDAVHDLSLGQHMEVELGRGTADFPAILGQLEEYRYRGWLTVKRHNSRDPVADAENAIAFLRAL